jgi:NADH-quinone oxidoreductase subunit M
MTVLEPILAQATTTQQTLLPMLIALPLLGGLIVSLVRDSTLARTIAFFVSLAVLLFAGMLLVRTVGSDAVAHHAWVAPSTLTLAFDPANPAYSFSLSLGADAISLWLVGLTAILVPCAMMATPSVLDRAGAYFAWILLLEAAIIGVFLANDLLLFYFFFELTLVPSFFLIGQWGGIERRYAATMFFVFTFVGSVFMLVSILYIVSSAHTFNINACIDYVRHHMTDRQQFWVMIGLLAGLGVKTPLLPLHTWLPTTYTQAPAPVTALLSGLLAKLGTYGILRLAMPIAVGGAQECLIAWVIGLSLAAIVYAALIAWVQKDVKTLVAYSSISHLGFCVLALAMLNVMGGQASVLYMVNHGISTAAVFLMLGMIETRMGTRAIDQVSGLGRERPLLAFFFVLFVMSSIGLPLTNGFVSEFLSILSTVGYSLWVTVIAASGVVLGAVYMLHLTAKLIFGPVRQPAEIIGTPGDLSGRELLAVVPLAVLVIVLGVMPNLVLESIKTPVAAIMAPEPVRNAGTIVVEAPIVSAAPLN